MSTKTIKSQLSLRLTEDGQEMLGLLAEKHGIGKAAMMEILIRDAVEAEGIIYIKKSIDNINQAEYNPM